MDNNTPMISYAAHEGMMARMERTIRRLWILCIILIILLAGTNAAWFYHESQFEDVVSTEISQDVNSDDGGMSYDDGMVEELRDLMDRAPDESTRREFHKLITKLEQM